MTAETTMMVLTIISVLIAVIAIGVARSARDEALRANLLSTNANSISRTANRLAEDSNSIAKGAANSAAEANRFSSESNAIARSAADAARAAPTEVAWDEALVAVAALQSANPADPAERASSLLTAMRTRTLLLIDRLDWDGFGEWIAHEHRRGVLLMREVQATAVSLAQQTGRLSVEQTMDVNQAFWTWVAAYTQNLRRFRRVGHEPATCDRLAAIARTEWKAICARNGWPEDPESIPGLSPLSDTEAG